MTESDETQAELEQDLDADIVNLSQADIGTVEADMVRIQQGGARRVVANDVEISRGGAGVVTAESASLQFSAAMALRGDLVAMDRSAAAVLVADKVRLDRSSSAVTITRTADMKGGRSIFLLAREVRGPVETVFDTRGSLVLGLVAGAATALVLLIGRLLRD